MRLLELVLDVAFGDGVEAGVKGSLLPLSIVALLNILLLPRTFGLLPLKLLLYLLPLAQSVLDLLFTRKSVHIVVRCPEEAPIVVRVFKLTLDFFHVRV